MRPAVHTASLIAATCLALGCAAGNRQPMRDGGPGDTGPSDAGTADGGLMDSAVAMDATPPPRDAAPHDARLDPDAACASTVVAATVERLPVDIIWMVDNSVSMEPAITEVNAGLNHFADVIGMSGIDYRVIMLSLRGPGRLTVSGSARFGVCIPPPLAGDASCGDGARFFQVETDVHSTQQVEQLLGTLGQTSGYRPGDARGSVPWLPLLRTDATKTIVVVTDDNSRICDRPGGSGCSASDPPLTLTSLEDFPGGPNPFNSTDLGPGLLTATYGTMFEGYTFDALYGWGSDTDPDVKCTYPGGGSPPSPGQTYTSLVTRTGGVRAQICQGSAAWGPFFDSVASAVTRTSRIDCNVAIPPPPDGMTFDPALVNVIVRSSADSTYLPRRTDASACDAAGGWYYDNPSAPTQVVLCPTSCDAAQATLAAPETGLDVQLGCASLLI